MDSDNIMMNSNISILKQQLHVLIQSRRYDDAKRLAQNILNIAPDDADANLFLAQFYESLGDVVKAVECYWASSKSLLPNETRRELCMTT